MDMKAPMLSSQIATPSSGTPRPASGSMHSIFAAGPGIRLFRWVLKARFLGYVVLWMDSPGKHHPEAHELVLPAVRRQEVYSSGALHGCTCACAFVDIVWGIGLRHLTQAGLGYDLKVQWFVVLSAYLYSTT